MERVAVNCMVWATLSKQPKQKTPETKLEAGAVKSNGESNVSGAGRYQLDGPKAPAISNQAQVVANLMGELAPTIDSTDEHYRESAER